MTEEADNQQGFADLREGRYRRITPEVLQQEQDAASSETAAWRVKQVVPPAKLAVEAYVFHKGTLTLGIPGVAVLADPLAKDTGPQGFANYLNALEAKAGLLDEARK